ncbi:MAG: D-alanyl-D-alanine carboxypeptidase/D-alanyl-D-alanine-endopeptidase [Nocardioidaceae bacterium]|nr:D-alanyl-D-alanine carboxypeptidase/D-alanyl-D-alanine-endopeptidase [Nocardioidaceae bacterium]
MVLTLLIAGATYRFDLGARLLGLDEPSPVEVPAQAPTPAPTTAQAPVDVPAEVVAPPEVSLPPAPEPDAVADAVEPQAADPRAVRRTVRPLVSDRRLGPDVAVAVNQLSDGASVYRSGPSRMVPASTLKLLTTGAALVRLGGEHRFSTRVVDGAGRRVIVLVGGGDPFLAREPVSDDTVYPPRADIVTLARSTARALRADGRTRVRLRYDASLFTGPSASSHWEASYLPDNVVSPISSLWVDQGRLPDSYVRSVEPALDAARAFGQALRSRGIRVLGEPVEGLAGPRDAGLAVVRSAPLAQIVERVLDVSDNEAAEVLARHVALAGGEPASFAGASRAVVDAMAEVGVDAGRATIYDGSGLSRDNRVAPETLLSVLETAASAEHPEMRPLLTGLPVAGFTGSLTYRFDTGAPQGLGIVRAKTGSLRRVQGLAGTLATRDGAVLTFVAMADRVRVRDTLDARAVLDRIAAALAACRCTASG